MYNFYPARPHVLNIDESTHAEAYYLECENIEELNEFLDIRCNKHNYTSDIIKKNELKFPCKFLVITGMNQEFKNLILL